MRLGDIVEAAFGRMFGRILRRAAWAGFAALLGVIALYHLTVAGTLALEGRYGVLDARLIVGAAYLAAGAITVLALWMSRAKRPGAREKLDEALASPRSAQLAMLLEAAIIGFSAGKKAPRSLKL